MKLSILPVEEIRPLRLKILRPGCQPDSVIYDCDIDPTCFHIGAKIKDKVVGVATFYQLDHKEIKGKKSCRLRGMATDDKFQNQGIGKEVLEYSFLYLKNKNIDLLWCNARLIAIGFYKKIGFKVYGDLFEIKNIGPHYDMYIRL